MSMLMEFEKKNPELIKEGVFRLKILEKVFELMEIKKITQENLAIKMGISSKNLGKILSNDRELSLSNIFKIYSALGEEPVISTKN